MQNPLLPPFPCNALKLDLWPLGDGAFVLDDRLVNYSELQAEAELEAKLAAAASLNSGGDGFKLPNTYSLLCYPSNILCLEILSVDLTGQVADLLAHNTHDNLFIQLLSKTNLLQPAWTLVDYQPGTPGTNQTEFYPVGIDGNPTKFFWAHEAEWAIFIGVGQDIAFEPQGNMPGLNRSFNVTRLPANIGVTNDLTVYYRITGTASNNVDYTLLSGMMTFSNNLGFADIEVQPLADPLLEGAESVTVTLIPTNTYLITSENQSVATIYIFDSSTTVSIGVPTNGVIEPDGPPGAPAVSASFLISRSDERGIYTNLDVYYSVTGTASNGGDYSFLTNQVHFAPDMMATNILINPQGDGVIEGLETVELTLVPTNAYRVAAPPDNAATNTILDSSTTVSLEAPPGDAIEPDGPPGAPAVVASFVVHRFDTRGIYTNLLVPYTISGTASNGADYSSISNVASFANGSTNVTILINPLADPLPEGLESVTLTLLATNGYYIDADNATATNFINDSTTTVSVAAGANAIEPGQTTNFPGQAGNFVLTRSDTRGITNFAMTVKYLLSGVAINDVDYTNLSGTATFAPGKTSTNIFVNPRADFLIEGDETVTLTLLATNGYLMETNASSATITIADNLPTNFFQVVASVSQPIGIDYHALSNSIIVSSISSGGFVRVYTNLNVSNSIVTVITNWSKISGLSDEVKLATVKTNASGFTNGEIYFGSDTGIGRLSADGTSSNLNWCVLTNATVTNVLLLRGSLYVDQTGVFSNQVIAVTSGGASSPRKGVWRVDAQAHPTLLTNLLTAHLEGVITLPNDTSKWGPWAGKIITGDEEKDPPLIYTIATNGAVVTYDTTTLISGGIHPEDFDIIPTNQSLYACDYNSNTIVKLSKNYLTNYVGDLLITDAGENVLPSLGKLFIVHWDAAATNFITRRITYKRANGSNGRFEHVTFAPIELPVQ